MKLNNIHTNNELLNVVRYSLPHLISIAQSLYDKWAQSRPGDGLCSYMAESWAKYINDTYKSQGIHATEYYEQPIGIGEHVEVMVYNDTTSYIIDLPHTLYEKKISRHKWAKVPGVRFNTGQITIRLGPPME